MLLRKYGSFLLAAAISVTAFSCDDDDDPIVDITDPEVIITSPTDEQLTAGYTQGETIEVRGSASDNGTLDFVEINVFAPDGTAWYTNTDLSDINEDNVSISDDILIPMEAPIGTHTLEIIVNDVEGNTQSDEWTFEVMAPMPDDNATFNVTVPESTPESAQIFLAGDITEGETDVDGEWELTDNGDGTYSASFYVPADTEYKLRIKTDDESDVWRYVETDENCEDIAEGGTDGSRMYTASDDMQTFDITVANWNNLGDCTQ